MKENKGRERKKRKWEKIEKKTEGRERKRRSGKRKKNEKRGKIEGKETKTKMLEIWEERRG